MNGSYDSEGFSPEIPDKTDTEIKGFSVGRLLLSIIIVIAIIGGVVLLMPVVICILLGFWPLTIIAIVVAVINISKFLSKRDS